jgi:hypothetical protein
MKRDMRATNARALLVLCKSCAATRILNVDGFPDSVPLQAMRRESVSCALLGGTIVPPAFERMAHLRPSPNALVVTLRFHDTRRASSQTK